MKPVKQTKLYTPDAPERGNCMAAAFASLLEIPLWMVPAFENMEPPLWQIRLDEWLERFFGLELEAAKPGYHTAGLPEFYIANGMSPRGVMHSVIYSNGALVHDPHPSNAGIETVKYIWFLKPITAES